VVGLLKSFHDKRSIAAYLIRPVQDFNEITHHFLEAIQTHLYNTRGPHAALAQAHPPVTSAQRTPAKANQNQNQNQNQRQQQQQQHDDQAEQQQTLPQQILQLLAASKGDEGVSIQEIANVFHEVATMDHVREAIEFLSDQALIYPTIDDQHFAVTES
jgi:replication factor A2